MPNVIHKKLARDALEAMDDLMGEATGRKPVQDWGRVNRVLIELSEIAKETSEDEDGE